jgi:hypothetical protein
MLLGIVVMLAFPLTKPVTKIHRVRCWSCAYLLQVSKKTVDYLPQYKDTEKVFGQNQFLLRFMHII